MHLNSMVIAHLKSNFYPPLSAEFADAAVAAIGLVSAGNGQTRLTLPTGREAAAEDIVSALDLQAFVEGVSAESAATRD